MATDRMYRVRSLLYELRSLSGPERDALLDRACRGDDDLRAEVLDLLARQSPTDRFLNQREVLEAISLPCPTYVGPYQIVRTLGEGGMGVVYEATDPKARRRVAVKVLKGSSRMEDAEGDKLFQREIRSLARLNHPGIATLFEAGRTEHGRAFFAMELAEGEPLDEYLLTDARPSGNLRNWIKRRLELFQSITEAVTYAHQRGVIHRDLKPSNVHVSRAGAVKILDFGLARITDADASLATMGVEAGSIQGTIAYMSPEQARGEPGDVDFRSDIYSLGIILYEMIAGGRPYDTRGRTILQAVELICESRVGPPSRAAPGIASELDVIVSKALEKDPDQRYQSAADLGEDVRRFLANEPILARRHSIGYRFRKMIRRNTVAAGTVALIAVLVVSFGTTMSILYGAQKREHERADHEAGKIAQVNNFLQELLRTPGASSSQTLTIREATDAATERLAAGEFEGAPEIRAALHRTAAVIYTQLHLYEDAEAHMDSALALLRLSPPPAQLDRGDYLNDKASLVYYSGRIAQADSIARLAYQEITEARGHEAPGVEVAINNMSNCALVLGRVAEAESLAHRSVELHRERYGDRSPELTVALNQLASIHYRRNDYSEATEVLNEVLDIHLANGESDKPIAFVMNNLGMVLSAQGEMDPAIAALREAYERSRRFAGDQSLDTAQYAGNLAVALGRVGDHQAADSLMAAALDVRRRLGGPTHPSVLFGLRNLAKILRDAGEFPRAESAVREAIEVAHIRADTMQSAKCTELLAEILAASGGPSHENAHLLSREAARE